MVCTGVWCSALEASTAAQATATLRGRLRPPASSTSRVKSAGRKVGPEGIWGRTFEGVAPTAISVCASYPPRPAHRQQAPLTRDLFFRHKQQRCRQHALHHLHNGSRYSQSQRLRGKVCIAGMGSHAQCILSSGGAPDSPQGGTATCPAPTLVRRPR